MNSLRPTTPPAPVRQVLPRLRLRLLVVPVLLKILWLHYSSAQGRQFSHLGRRRSQPRKALHDNWAFWASHRIGRFIYRIPILRRRPCYWRSQLIFDILPRFGFPVKMHLGAARGSGNPDESIVHVWVSLRGAVLGGSDDGPSRYVELAAYGGEEPEDKLKEDTTDKVRHKMKDELHEMAE